MDFVEKRNIKKINDVNIDIDAVAQVHSKASKQTLADVYFGHLPLQFQQSGAEALYAELRGKDAPESAAEVIVPDEYQG